MVRDDRRLRLARELLAELGDDAGDAGPLLRVAVLALERGEILRSPRSGKPTMLLRRALRMLERIDVEE